MSNDLDKVRYSHSGHDFHFLWTARRTLNLLNPKSNLVAVSIEGISSREDKASDEKGLLAIDTAEYYGSEKIEDAQKIKYFQLKYSTVNPNKKWTTAQISPRKVGVAKGTIVSFAVNFKENLAKYGENAVLSKFEYYFVTNRPIDPDIKTLIELNSKNKQYTDLTKEVQKVYNRFFEDCGLEETEFKIFLKLLGFLDIQDSRYTQKSELNKEVNKFMPEFDIDAPLKLKELIRSRVMPEHTNDPVIRKETIYHAFGVTKIEDLLPAASQFEKLDTYIHRMQEDDIVKQIIVSSSPVVIHASGGVGKSIFAQNLSSLMPEGSKTVIFDGFANGSYRAPSDQRHLHKNGLTQIINEFAFDGLCMPLLPKIASIDNYLKTFYNRLKEIVFETKKNAPDALVVIILDAADNTEMAAQEYGNRASFAKDLLQAIPPDGCKIIAFSRSERLKILNLPSNTLKIELNSFSEKETEYNVKNKFSYIDRGELIEFHKLTFGNPRVQSYLLSSNKSLQDILRQLGHKGLSSEALIESQLEVSLNKIKEQSHSKSEIDLLCQALSLLPPMVPIEILEIATGIDKSLIISFVSDMGLALLIKENSVQFRDEPVESWFRNKFQVTEVFYKILATKLNDYVKTDAYIAMTMPRILFGAKEYQMLYTSVYNNENITIEDPIQRQNIILENITFAVKIAKQKNDIHNLSKLLLEASKILSSKDRQSEFILQNSDLIATLVGPEFINDFLYRDKQSFHSGIVYASSALMLSLEPVFHAEARSFLRLTNEYLKEWMNLSEDRRNIYRIDERDIANIALAYLYLYDAKVSTHELNRWVSESMKFSAMRLITRHLIEQNQETRISELLSVVAKDINLLFAMILELYKSKKTIPKKIIADSVGVLLKYQNTKRINLLAVLAIAELAITHQLEIITIIELLEKYLSTIDGYMHPPMQNEEDKRDIALRFITLLKVLKNEEISINNFVKDIEKEKNKDIKYVYNQLLPLYKLNADIRINSQNDKHEILEEMKKILNDIPSNGWQYEKSYKYIDIPYLKAYICMDILILCDEVTQHEVIINFLNKTNNSIPYFVWINLLNKITFVNQKIALDFAQLAYASIASGKITSYTSSEYAALARAVLPINKEDAKEYFKLATESNSTLGEDARGRLDALCSIARNINYDDQNYELAYRLLKVSEMVYYFDNHKFPWFRVIGSIEDIDKSSSLAIASRLKDRGTISYYNVLAPLLNKLLKQEDISPQTFASIFILAKSSTWELAEGIENIIQLSSDKSDAKIAIDILIKDVYFEYEDTQKYSIKKVKAILDEHNIYNQMIEDLLSMHGKEKNELTHAISRDKNNIIDWDKIFLDYRCLSVAEIDESFKRFRENTQYGDSSLFYKEMRLRVPINRRIEHLDIVVDYIAADILFDELEKYADDWMGIGVQKHMPRLIEYILKNKVSMIIEHRLNKNLNICEKLSKKTRTDLVTLLLKNGFDDISNYSHETILTVVDELSNHVSSSECMDILSFGIEQFKDDIEDDGSDGEWREELKPSANISETIGGFIYTYLGSTRAEDRWRAMHAVRRLCLFGEENIIANIIKQLDSNCFSSFTDSRYQFYDMHAKLYLFIALARGVKENPVALLKFADIFKYYALDYLPHILIRKYSSEIAIALEDIFPTTYRSDIFEKIKTSNNSPFPICKITSQEKYRKQRESKLEKKSRMSFGIDFEPYWFEPLADVFNISTADITQMVENWIIDKWGYSEDIECWDKDLRAKHGIYEDGDTLHRHSDYPLEDRHSFYLIYHAMFCVAGELLSEYPIRYEIDCEENLWDEWIKRHIPRREDGKWISDRKDIMPIDLYFDNYEERKDDNWEFSISHNDFDRCLRFKEAKFEYLPINASWKMNNESVTINSVLVSSENSHALLRALQTVDNPNDFYLAPYNDSSLKKYYEYKMTGWISDESSIELGIDKFDPMAKISYPPTCPAPNIQKLCRLTADEESRIWKDSNGCIMFRSEIWGNHQEHIEYGKRLQVKYSSLISMLKVLNKDLLVNVEIKREKMYNYYKKDKIYYSPYFKLYLFKKDGSVHELYKNYKIR